MSIKSPVFTLQVIVDFSSSKKGWAGIRDIDKAVVKEAEADAEFKSSNGKEE